MNRLPYVQEYRDRHGKIRRYFRRSGSRRIPLPGRPGSQEFMTAYNAAQAGYVVREMPAFELYLNSPQTTGPEDLLTVIHIPFEA